MNSVHISIADVNILKFFVCSYKERYLQMKTLGKYWVFNLDCHVIKSSEAGELLFLRNIYVREIQNSKKKVEIEINYFGHCSKYIDISLLYIQIRLKSATNCLNFFRAIAKKF